MVGRISRGRGRKAGILIRCDVLIVGGGPAGLAAAIALRQKGMEVLVVDALHPPIDKACGEGLMPDSQTEVTRLGISISDQDGAPLDGIAFLSQRSSVVARFEHGAGIGIRRLRLHSLLVDRCSHLGVQLMWGSRVSLVDSQTVRSESQRVPVPLPNWSRWTILCSSSMERPGSTDYQQQKVRDSPALPHTAMESHGGSALGRSRSRLRHSGRAGGSVRRHAGSRLIRQDGSAPGRTADPDAETKWLLCGEQASRSHYHNAKNPPGDRR